MRQVGWHIAILDEAFNEVINIYNELGASDKVAKGSVLLKRLLNQPIENAN